MLKKRAADFAEHVWIASTMVGLSPPRIADHIIGDLFPATLAASEDEGASRMLRVGVVEEVRRILRTAPTDERQSDLANVDASFRPIVEKLKRPSYHVEQVCEEVPVAQLISEPV